MFLVPHSRHLLNFKPHFRKVISLFVRLIPPKYNCFYANLKCYWDQNFGIPYFCIFENSLWSLVTMPNFNSLRRLEVAFFGRFLSRFYGRHYRPLFRKLACELAEVTLEAHLKPSQASFRGKFNCYRGKISCQLFAVRP